MDGSRTIGRETFRIRGFLLRFKQGNSTRGSQKKRKGRREGRRERENRLPPLSGLLRSLPTPLLVHGKESLGKNRPSHASPRRTGNRSTFSPPPSHSLRSDPLFYPKRTARGSFCIATHPSETWTWFSGYGRLSLSLFSSIDRSIDRWIVSLRASLSLLRVFVSPSVLSLLPPPKQDPAAFFLLWSLLSPRERKGKRTIRGIERDLPCWKKRGGGGVGEIDSEEERRDCAHVRESTSHA